MNAQSNHAVAHDHHGPDDHDHGHGHDQSLLLALVLFDQPQRHRHAYMIFAVVAGLIGGAISVWMRLNLMHPGSHFVHSGQEWKCIDNGPWRYHGLFLHRHACAYRRVSVTGLFR